MGFSNFVKNGGDIQKNINAEDDEKRLKKNRENKAHVSDKEVNYFLTLKRKSTYLLD